MEEGGRAVETSWLEGFGVEIFDNVVVDEADLEMQSSTIGYRSSMWRQVQSCVAGARDFGGLEVWIWCDRVWGALSTVSHVRIDRERPGLDWFPRPGAVKLDKVDEPFFSFCLPQPRGGPPPSPTMFRGRWKGDAWRLAPYHYQGSNLVRTSSGVRRLLADEQLRMSGFHTAHLDLKMKL